MKRDTPEELRQPAPQKAPWRRIELGVPDPFAVEAGGKLRPCYLHVWLDEPWFAVLTLRAQEGVPVIESVEVRVRPVEFSRDLDPETNKLPGEIPLPKGGLPLRVVRNQLAFKDALAFARKYLHEFEDESLSAHGFSREVLDAPRQPGKRGRSDRYYAEICVRYLQAVRRGSNQPNVDVARELGPAYTADYISGAIQAARRDRDLLTKPRPGTAGGELTPKARRVLGSQGSSEQ